MAQGNAYLVIAAAQFTDTAPAKVVGKYGWQEPITDENGQPVLDGNGDPTYNEISPTWEQYAEKYTRQFGPAVTVEHPLGSGTEFKLIEIELSLINGEFTEVLDLQKNKNWPDYRILNNTEARKFIQGELTEADEVK